MHVRVEPRACAIARWPDLDAAAGAGAAERTGIGALTMFIGSTSMSRQPINRRRGASSKEPRMNRPQTVIGFVNAAHFIDHYAMLVFAAAVILMGPALGISYSELLPYATPGFVAFGAGSLLTGWLGDRWSRRHMMAIFFLGIGVSMIAGRPGADAAATRRGAVRGRRCSPRSTIRSAPRCWCPMPTGSAARSASTGSGAIWASPHRR